MEAQGNEAFDPRQMMKLAMGKLMMTLTYGFSSEEILDKIAGITRCLTFRVEIHIGVSEFAVI